MRAEKMAMGTVTQQTPDGFPGPTTVLLITARSDSGTAPRHMLDLIRLLKTTGIRVFVASPVNPPYGFELKKIADKFIPIPHRDFSLAALMRIRKSIRKHGINIIHSHGRTAGVYSRLLGLLTGVSVAHSYHGVQSESGFMGQLKLRIDQLLAGLRYDAVFSSAAERFKAIEKKVVKANRESYVIESAVDLGQYPVRKTSNLALGRVDRAKPETLTDIRIGAYLRSDNSRGHDHFLRLVSEAGAQGKFTCAGISRERLAQVGPIPDHLEVVGPVADPQKWLYSLDVFVSTMTGIEGQVGSTLEAMAAGAVCLLSNVPGHEQFHKQHAAVLFDPKSTANFTAVLNDVRGDKALRDMVVGNSRYMIERFHDAGTFKTKLLDLYRTGAKRTAGLVL